MGHVTINDIQARTGLSVSTIRRRLSQNNVKGERVTKSGGGAIMLYPKGVCAKLFAFDLVMTQSDDTVKNQVDTVTTQSDDTVGKAPGTGLALMETKYQIVLRMVTRLQMEVKHQKEINTIQAQVISAQTERERHLIEQAERYGRQLSVALQQQHEAKQLTQATPSAGMTHGTAAVWFASAIILVGAVIIAVLLFS